MPCQYYGMDSEVYSFLLYLYVTMQIELCNLYFRIHLFAYFFIISLMNSYFYFKGKAVISLVQYMYIIYTQNK